MTSLTEQELLALGALCNAATPPPWESEEEYPEFISESQGLLLCEVRGEGARLPIPANSAFIRAARAALPRVLQELRDARARVQELERSIYDPESIERERDDFARRCIWVARRMAEQAGGNILVENVLAAVKAGLARTSKEVDAALVAVKQDLAREQEKSKP